GALYWTAATGVRAVLSGPVRDAWARTGWENGALGYPVSDTVCTSSECSQRFQFGSISAPQGGAVVVRIG
ncbi:LGFP repeat-containing protein, partial [Modestobacter sp. SYSU DS0875]